VSTVNSKVDVPQVSVILPCLNEEDSIAATVAEAWAGLDRGGYSGEVLVVDNGSTDRSVALAVDAGARVVCQEVRGYGAALRRGIDEADAAIAVMADADLTYDLPNLGQLVSMVEDGADLVLASRLDGLNSDTMPFLHRVLGTPVLSFLLRRVTNGRILVRDSQSGYRAFRTNRIRTLELQGDGMEFASEMLLQASLASYRIQETKLPYRPRRGESKLNTVQDGLRHLKLLVLLAPRIALLWPAVALGLLGLMLTVMSLGWPDGITIGAARWQPMFFGPIALVMASLLYVVFLMLGVASPIRALPATPRSHERLRHRILMGGTAMLSTGVGLNFLLFVKWVHDSVAWTRGFALAGLAQALTLSGAVWLTSGFLHWLLQRQYEYGAARQSIDLKAVADRS